MKNKLDSEDYRKYTTRSEYDKAIHTLEGLLSGISIDNKIDKQELQELKNWCSDNNKFLKKQPFKDLIPYIIEALEDDYLDEEEHNNIIQMCKYFKSGSKYYDIVTSDLQRLQGIMHGIMANNEISDEEIHELDTWIEQNDHLIGLYPYDELYSLLLAVLEDNIITDTERNILKVFFSDFIPERDSSTIDYPEIEKLKSAIIIPGLTTSNPDIVFQDKVFCISGKFRDNKRSDIAQMITDLGGTFKSGMSKDVDYLIVGTEGNPAWAFSCYGRKIEYATNQRKQGSRIQIVREEDFIDAYEDNL